MAANMKAVKLRMKSIQSTMQITKAMELVASSKLRKAKERADLSRPYFQTLHDTLTDIASGKLLESQAKGKDYSILPIGKKAVDYCKRRKVHILTEEFAEAGDISVSDCFEMAKLLCSAYCKGDFGHIALCYTSFLSMLSQRPDVSSLLPLDDFTEKEDGHDPKHIRSLILYEPDSESVFNAIVPEYLAGLIYGAMCESVASELAARRTAMDAATKNAGEMIEQLSLYYNRARQASITQEITEIVAGAEQP